MNTLKINNYDVSLEEKTALTANVALGATSLPVKNISGFADNDWVILDYGNEAGEITDITATPASNALAVTAIKKAHNRNVSITRTPYNQIKVYSSTSKTGTFTLLTTLAMEVDQNYTLYNDTAGNSSTWYKITFYNSQSTVETSLADTRAVKASVILDASPMSQNANSYATIDMADEFFDGHIDGGLWSDLTDQDKARYLIEATRRLEGFNFAGQKVWKNQKLQFPILEYSDLDTGTADSGTTTTLVDLQLAGDTDNYDDYWKYGGLLIEDGTNEYEARLITGYNHSTGTITVEIAFSEAIDNTSDYYLVKQIPQEILTALYETIIWMIKSRNSGDRDPSVKSESFDDYSVSYFAPSETATIPSIAYGLVRKYVRTFGSITVK